MSLILTVYDLPATNIHYLLIHCSCCVQIDGHPYHM